MLREPLLPTKQIQGNILPGFNKDFQTLLFLKITNVPSFKRWLGSLMPSVTTMARVLDFRCQLLRSGARPKATWLNIAFSHAGLKELDAFKDSPDFTDEAFTRGLWQRSAELGDPTDPTHLGCQKNWIVGGEKNEAHLVLIVASDDPLDLSAEVKRIKATIEANSGAHLFFEQSGAVLPGPLAGHEHFGFRDGVSQPGVRGVIAQTPDNFLTPRQNPKKNHQGKPRQDLLWPGEFVFGYAGQDAKNAVEEPGEIVNAGPVWACNGSFLVFRRLRQEVGAFHQFLQATAQHLNMDVGLLGAKCVGRWASGAPILRAPELDDAGLAQDDLRNNDFEFHEDDSKGERCPFAGHIRKTYPRDDVRYAEENLPTDDQTLNERITQTHRLLRRGIPYGDPSCSTPSAPVQDDVDRGLLFLAYQTSIVEQFEFVQKEFANNPDFKETRTGYDPLIGQNGKSPKRERDFVVTIQEYEDESGNRRETTRRITTEKEWVIPTGGGYFFAPSIDTLNIFTK